MIEGKKAVRSAILKLTLLYKAQKHFIKIHHNKKELTNSYLISLKNFNKIRDSI
ncbi:hypothetical protein GAPWKB30_0708 [Gilliamella apicola]|nr:hypothetical protein GAPWKB30_0708 [Gilliamella apicola]